MNNKLWKILATVAVALLAVLTALAAIAVVPAEEAVPRAYQCAVYTEQGCAKFVVASGGEIEIQSGATFDLQSGATIDFSGGVDLDGALLDIDADGDTSLQADTDDQIDIEIAGADDFQFTANTFTVLAGSTVALPATADINAYGYVAVGDGTPDGSVAAGTDEELYVEGDFEVDGEAEFDGAIDADAGLTVDGGVTNIGGGSPDVAAGDNDLYVTGDLEVDGELQLDGTVDVNAVMTGIADLEHLFFPTIVISDVAYIDVGGTSGVVATIADGEVWFVWAVFVNVTADWDCGGDDCQFVVGDGADADGFVVLADAELQAADTEQTGSPAGWQGLVAATMGVYLDGAVSSAPHIYAPSGASETIDFLADEGSGTTMSAGTATIYVIYTRIQ